jgi:gliding motility-associated-like protein
MRFSTFIQLFQLFTIIFIFPSHFFSQGQADNWYFGNRAAISFSTNPPTALTGSVMNAWEGVASISDASGQLLFYSDGIKVWDRNNNQMPNGNNLNGDPSSAQSGVIVPHPGNPNLYYLFTVPSGGGSAFTPARLYYSVVDMTLNGGLGDVISTQKNINISPNHRIQEKVCAILHCNGKDVWVLAHEYGSNRFLIYSVTETTGPTLVTTQTIGETWAGNTNASIGIMKASPDGKKIGDTGNSNNKGQVLDFNNQTGVLSNPITLTNIGWAYGIEFSPNSQVLYMNSWYDLNPSRLIYQYNLQAPNVDASRVNISTQAFLGSMQLGKDNKIYVARNTSDNGGANSGRKHLGILSNPNNFDGTATACGWIEQGLDLGGNESQASAGRLSRYGLPNFLQSYFQTEAAFTYADTCLNNNTSFTAQISETYDSLRWNFGGLGQALVSPTTFTFPTEGTYTVELYIFYPCRTDTITQNVQIVSSSVSGFNGPLAVCQGETSTYSVSGSGVFTWNISGGTIDSGNGTNTVSVTWGTGTSGSVNIVPASGGGCGNANYSVVISQGGTPTFNLPASICQGSGFTLPTTSENGISGTWTPALNTNNLGQQNITFQPNGGACFQPFSTAISVVAQPTVEVQGTNNICQGQAFNLSTSVSPVGGTFLWSPGGQTTSVLSGTATQSTNYSVVYTLNGCQSEPATWDLSVLTAAPINAGNDTTICAGGTAILTATGNPGPFTWSNNVQDGVPFSPNQTQTYVVSAPNANGCTSTDVVQITVRPLPTVSAGPDVVICEGDLVNFNATGVGVNGTYTWSNGAVNGSSVFVNQNSSFTVVGTDNLGCENSATFSVTVVPSPQVSFSPSTLSGTPPLTVTFVNTSQNANVFLWNFGTGANSQTNDLSSTQVIYTVPGAYLVTLSVNNGACSSSADTIITVLPFGDPEIIVPNVFTPNGSEPNDLWQPTLTNVSTIDIQIFNRWGNVVRNLNQLDPTWDGTTTNGTAVTDGVYFYRYSLIGVNGARLEGHGFVTVVR